MVPGLTPSQQCVFFLLLNIRFSSSHFSNLLRSLSAIWCVNHFSKLCIICKTADSVHYHITHVINKDVKQNFPWWNCEYELVNSDWLFCTLFRTSAEINFFWRVLYVYIFTRNFKRILGVWFCQGIALANQAPKFYLCSRSWRQCPSHHEYPSDPSLPDWDIPFAFQPGSPLPHFIVCHPLPPLPFSVWSSAHQISHLPGKYALVSLNQVDPIASKQSLSSKTVP